MRIVETSLVGCFVIEAVPVFDERGSFTRVFDVEEFQRHALDASVAQCSLSFNAQMHTLRGLHFQAQPFGEVKLVRCTRGRMFDVAVDLRRSSPTFGQWTARELSAENREALYIPKGMAHGFLTLEEGTEVYYQISSPYVPDQGRGIRWDDTRVNIKWPSEPQIISSRDRTLPLLHEIEAW